MNYLGGGGHRCGSNVGDYGLLWLREVGLGAEVVAVEEGGGGAGGDA